jgi:hypothetical protein
MNGSRFGSSEDPRESNLETRRILLGRHVLSGGCDLFNGCKITG